MRLQRSLLRPSSLAVQINQAPGDAKNDTTDTTVDKALHSDCADNTAPDAGVGAPLVPYCFVSPNRRDTARPG